MDTKKESPGAFPQPEAAPPEDPLSQSGPGPCSGETDVSSAGLDDSPASPADLPASHPEQVGRRPARRRRSRPIAPLPDLPKGADYLMPAQEAAGYLALTPNALAKWRCQGKHLPFVKIGSGKGQVRYRLLDLYQFIERSLRRSTSEEAPAKGKAMSLASASLFRLPRGKKSR